VATDDCSNVTISFQTFNTSVTNACQNYTIVRKWTATDACGNVASVQQILTVIQTQPPVFNLPLPQNVTLDCTQNYSAPVVTANDVCGPAPVSLQVLQISNDFCTRVVRYTWTATNLCGLTVTHVIYVTITDRVPPTITTPSDFSPVITINCNATSLPPSLCCEDNCPGAIFTFNETRVPDAACPSQYDLLRTWRCIDACGNVASKTQTVHIVDNFPPIFNDLPPNQNLSASTAA